MLRVTCGPVLGTWSSGPLHVLQGLQADVGEREVLASRALGVSSPVYR